MTRVNEAIAVFRHPNNIQVGKGRVLWGNPTIPSLEGPTKGVNLAAGWVLPGGRRTTSVEEATAWAKQIDDSYVRATRGAK